MVTKEEWCVGAGSGLGGGEGCRQVASGGYLLVVDRCLVSGVKCMESGGWCLASGDWCLVSGDCCQVAGVRCPMPGVW